MAKDKSKKTHEEEVEKPENIEQEVTHEEPETAEAETSPEEPKEAHEGGSKKDWFKHCWQWLLNHKWVSIPLAVLLVLALLAAIPFTRFAIAGLVVKQNFPVIVLDSETQKPVTSATVKINGQEAETDSEGRATIRTNVGSAELTVSKKYYHDASADVVVPIGKPKSDFKVALQADGRPVPVTVLNSISGKPVANVTITTEGTEAKTDQDGKATVVLPADKKDVAISITGEGFNTTTGTLTVTSDEVEANTFKVTPSGKIYFLSNASGKIDLVKSNLDGTDRQTVLAGTGKEEKFDTILLASRDWKYIALRSKRDGGEYAKLFLIETGSDKVTTMDEGEATFTMYGWSDDRFLYSVYRPKVKSWEPKQYAIKSYHAPGKKITTLDETTAEGNTNSHGYENYTDVYILDQELVFGKTWSGYPYYLQGKKATFNSIKADGTQKKTVKSYNATSLNTRAGDFGEIYVQYDPGTGSKVDSYQDGTIAESKLTYNDFYNESYPTYSVSPSGKKTLWSDSRDGKNVFFIGDGNGEGGVEIGRSSDFTIYGWFTDDYILLTKKGSELHIMPANADLEGGIEKSLKISDYYKPYYYNRGFGYGYGG